MLPGMFRLRRAPMLAQASLEVGLSWLIACVGLVRCCARARDLIHHQRVAVRACRSSRQPSNLSPPPLASPASLVISYWAGQRGAVLPRCPPLGCERPCRTTAMS